MSDLTPETIAGINDKFREKLCYVEADKPAVVEYIKKYIEHNGYINTRYATRMSIEGKTPETSFKDAIEADAFYESVSAILVNTGKYTRERNKIEDKGYNVLLNPSYFYNESVKSGNKTTRIIAGVSAFISLLSFVATFTHGTKQEPQRQQLDIQYQYPEKDKESLRNVLRKIDSLNQKIQQLDSLGHVK